MPEITKEQELIDRLEAIEYRLERIELFLTSKWDTEEYGISEPAEDTGQEDEFYHFKILLEERNKLAEQCNYRVVLYHEKDLNVHNIDERIKDIEEEIEKIKLYKENENN